MTVSDEKNVLDTFMRDELYGRERTVSLAVKLQIQSIERQSSLRLLLVHQFHNLNEGGQAEMSKESFPTYPPHRTSLHSTSACSITVCVAFSCLSGG